HVAVAGVRRPADPRGRIRPPLRRHPHPAPRRPTDLPRRRGARRPRGLATPLLTIVPAGGARPYPVWWPAPLAAPPAGDGGVRWDGGAEAGQAAVARRRDPDRPGAGRRAVAAACRRRDPRGHRADGRGELARSRGSGRKRVLLAPPARHSNLTACTVVPGP